jgi:hypothetical protein
VAREAGDRCGEGGAALEVEGAPDMWVPHVRERKRGERRERGAGAGGPRGPERGWAAAGIRKRGRELGRGRAVLFFFSFLFFFLFFSNPFQTNLFNTFKSNLFHILTQIYPTILRLLENLLNNFSNIFKFKLSSFFNSNFYTNFHNYF